MSWILYIDVKIHTLVGAIFRIECSVKISENHIIYPQVVSLVIMAGDMEVALF